MLTFLAAIKLMLLTQALNGHVLSGSRFWADQLCPSELVFFWFFSFAVRERTEGVQQMQRSLKLPPEYVSILHLECPPSLPPRPPKTQKRMQFLRVFCMHFRVSLPQSRPQVSNSLDGSVSFRFGEAEVSDSGLKFPIQPKA